MMDIEKISKIIDDYYLLIERAIWITDKAPYWAHCFEKADGNSNPKIYIAEGGDAVLSWCTAESGYEGSCSIELESKAFDAKLLLLNDEELAAWKEEQRLLYNEQQALASQATARAKKEERRMAFEALKREFGDA